MSIFELKRIENIRENGLLIANTSGNWDMYIYDDIMWSVPKTGSSAGLSFFCGIKTLKSHLMHLQYVCCGSGLIPDYWEVVNQDFFFSLGITA